MVKSVASYTCDSTCSFTRITVEIAFPFTEIALARCLRDAAATAAATSTTCNAHRSGFVTGDINKPLSGGCDGRGRSITEAAKVAGTVEVMGVRDNVGGNWVE